MLFRLCKYVIFVMMLFPKIASSQSEMTDLLVTDDDVDAELLNSVENVLFDLASNPIDLNSATESDLDVLYFLSDFQKQSILYYLNENRPLLSTNELQLCLGLDSLLVKRMLPYVCVRPILETNTWSAAFEKSRNNVISKSKMRLQDNNKWFADDSSQLGSSLYQKIKYNFSALDKMSIGLTIEKDAGERLWNDVSHSIDFVSAYVRVNSNRHLRKIILGDYSVLMGQGLIANSGFGFGKSCNTTIVRKSGETFRQYSASNEDKFYRGVATEMQFSKFMIALAISRNHYDAAIDSISKTVSSISTDYTHNSNAKLQKTNSLPLNSAFAKIGLNGEILKLNLNTLIHRYDFPIAKSSLKYKKYDFAGQTLANCSFDFVYNLQKTFVWGEIATDNYNHLAMICGTNLQPADEFQIALVYRNFDKAFCGINNSTFSEYSGVSNERGLYFGAQMNLPQNTILSAYYDIFNSPWLRYNSCASTDGDEQLLCLKSAPNQNFEIVAQYKREAKQITCNDSVVDFLADVVRQNIKIQTKYRASEKLQIGYSVLLGFYNHETHPREQSVYVAQNIAWQVSEHFKHKLQLAVFDATYNSRVYAYENDVAFAISSAMIYNQGVRAGYIANWNISRRFVAEFRLWHIIEIESSQTTLHATDATLQLRFKL